MDSQKTKITELLDTLLEGTDAYLVRITVSATKKVAVYLDADSGLSIDRCVRFNRGLYKAIVENGIFEDGEFALDVSSPGIDEPLVLDRQYLKNVNRLIHLTLEADEMEGRLKDIKDGVLNIEVKKDKKTTEILQVPMSDIKEAKILIEF